eukprot:274143-Amphidinium_carterae.1
MTFTSAFNAAGALLLSHYPLLCTRYLLGVCVEHDIFDTETHGPAVFKETAALGSEDILATASIRCRSS